MDKEMKGVKREKNEGLNVGGIYKGVKSLCGEPQMPEASHCQFIFSNKSFY